MAGKRPGRRPEEIRMTYVTAPRDTTMRDVGRARRPASEKQVAYARSLVVDRDVLPGMSAADAVAWFDATLDEHGMTMRQASALIERALGSARRTVTKPAAVEVGYYRLPDGEMVAVLPSRDGLRTYGKRLVMDGDKPEWVYAPGAAREAAKGERVTLEEAASFGLAHGYCLACGRLLTAEESVARGVGPICSEKF